MAPDGDRTHMHVHAHTHTGYRSGTFHKNIPLGALEMQPELLPLETCDVLGGVLGGIHIKSSGLRIILVRVTSSSALLRPPAPSSAHSTIQYTAAHSRIHRGHMGVNMSFNITSVKATCTKVLQDVLNTGRRTSWSCQMFVDDKGGRFKRTFSSTDLSGLKNIWNFFKWIVSDALDSFCEMIETAA